MTLRHPTYPQRPLPAPEPIKRHYCLLKWVLACMAIVAGISIARAVWGAERTTPGPHEITLLFDGADLEHVSRSFFTLSGPYESKAICERAKTGLVVMVKGARLRCDPAEKGK